MRVLMLGWEFPPSINGGLGTACAGLVRALNDVGTEVTFVVPESLPTTPVAHAAPFSVLAETPPPSAPEIASPEPTLPEPSPILTVRSPEPAKPSPVVIQPPDELRVFEHVTFRIVPVHLSPYDTTTELERLVWHTHEWHRPDPIVIEGEAPTNRWPTSRAPADTTLPPPPPQSFTPSPEPFPPPESGLLADVRQYTAFVERIAEEEDFDVIHAHDWMTFPAGLAVAARTGKPLVVHVHSTEGDRSGDHGDTRIADIERRGVHGAMRVIAASQYTKNALVQRYGVSPEKVDVIYNAVEPAPEHRLAADDFSIRKGEKVVLFLGRLTMQKGPDYFLTAARKVLEVTDDVKFVMAGDGDLARHTVELAAAFGIAHKVLFTGFLRGLDVERIFQIADLFVMPSVSEPFGIAPLEAVARNVPTIISKQSGVGEVLKHALKVDFWDTNELANKIVAVLRHPTLAAMMREEGGREVAKLSWAAAAKACLGIYAHVIDDMPVVA